MTTGTASDLHGVSPALVTPWAGDAIDVAGLERILAHVVPQGVSMVCPGGTTGEGPRLTRGQRVELTRRCVELTPSSVGVLAGAVTTSVAETLDEVEALASAGAAAVLMTPPTRLPLDSAACVDFYATMADRSPVPIVLYHFPALTGAPVPAEAVLALATHPAIIGLKDSSGDLQAHLLLADSLTRHAGDFALLTGTDGLLVASLQAGGAGTISASANLVPKLAVAIHRAVGAGDLDAALREQRVLRAVIRACRRGVGPAGWKAAMELFGLADRRPVPPGPSLAPDEFDALRDDLRRLELLP